jgi:hypothetical protein
VNSGMNAMYGLPTTCPQGNGNNVLLEVISQELSKENKVKCFRVRILLVRK